MRISDWSSECALPIYGIAAAEHLADRLQLFEIADRRAGAVGVDVVDRLVDPGERHLHAAHRPLARGLHHVEAVGGGAVADHLAVDPRPAGAGMLQRLQNHDAAAAGDHEAVTRSEEHTSELQSLMR